MAVSIPKAFIADLVSRADIVAVIQKRLKLKKAGAHYTALCPFHQEKTPSFMVSPRKQSYHCFGCAAHGDAIHFIQQYDKVDFRTALEELARSLGLTLPEEKDRQALPYQANWYRLLATITSYYQKNLTQNQTAIQYLKKRGLTGEICLRYGVGFASRDWHPFETLKLDRDALQATGMMTDKGGKRPYARFRNRIMFPIRDRHGQTIAFGGRSLDAQVPKYLNSPETPLFQKRHVLYGLYEAKQASDLSRVFVVEGYLDVLSLAQHSIPCTVATLGTAVSREHLQQLMRHTQHIIFCFDGDAAGDKAAMRTLTILLPMTRDHVRFEFLCLPKGEDPDQFVSTRGGKAWLAYVDQHVYPLHRFMIHTAKASLGKECASPEARSKVTYQLTEQLALMPNHFLKQFIMKAIAEAMTIDLAHLEKHTFGKKKKWEQAANGIAHARPHRLSITEPAKKALAWLVQQPTLASAVDFSFEPHGLEASEDLRLLHRLMTELKKQKPMTTASLLRYWQEDPAHPLLEQASLHTIVFPEEGQAEEFRALLQLVVEQIQQRHITHLLKKMHNTGLTQAEKHNLQRCIAKKLDFKRGDKV